jgi:hypothetical protein
VTQCPTDSDRDAGVLQQSDEMFGSCKCVEQYYPTDWLSERIWIFSTRSGFISL